MRRPTSGGQGLGSEPSRTARNCSQTPSEVGTGTLRSCLRPWRWIWSHLPQMSVCRIASWQKDAHIRRARTDRLAAAMHRDQLAGFQLADDHAHNVHRAPPIIQPGATSVQVLTGQIDTGVEHVRACVEQEAAARDFRILPPCRGVKLPQFCQTVARYLNISPNSPARSNFASSADIAARGCR